MSDPRNDGPSDMHKKRRARNIAMLVVLGALVVLFYVITIVKMGGGR